MENNKKEIKEEKVTENVIIQNKNGQGNIVFGIVSIAMLVVILQVFIIITNNNNLYYYLGKTVRSIIYFVLLTANIVISSIGLRIGIINKRKVIIIMCAIALGISIFFDVLSVSTMFNGIDEMIANS